MSENARSDDNQAQTTPTQLPAEVTGILFSLVPGDILCQAALINGELVFPEEVLRKLQQQA